jgi:hypothetical protein
MWATHALISQDIVRARAWPIHRRVRHDPGYAIRAECGADRYDRQLRRSIADAAHGRQKGARLSARYRIRTYRLISTCLRQILAKNQNTGYHAIMRIWTIRRERRDLADLICIDWGGACSNFLPASNARNPLKSLDSDERIQGNPSKTKASKPRKTASARAKTRRIQEFPNRRSGSGAHWQSDPSARPRLPG